MTETETKITEKYATREQWLHAAADVMRTWFEDEDHQVPEKIRLSVGFAKGAKTNAIGWCYRNEAAEDGINQIFVSPSLTDPVEVLATELHELVHSATNGHGHDKVFGKVARALGLTGKMTATVPGDELRKDLAELAEDLGVYPHGKLTHVATFKGKHNKYQTKLVCTQCAFEIPSVSRKKLEEFGYPEHHGEEMVEP
jgi:hypothetical protein